MLFAGVVVVAGRRFAGIFREVRSRSRAPILALDPGAFTGAATQNPCGSVITVCGMIVDGMW